MTRAKLKVGLICGGTSGEHQVSLVSAYHIHRALDRERFEVLMIGIAKNGTWFLGEPDGFLENVDDVRRVSFNAQTPARIPERSPRTASKENRASLAEIDIFFPITHGRLGEDGALQGLLELAGKPYVGADVYGSAVCMDKDVCKRLLMLRGIPVAPYRVLRSGESWSFSQAEEELGNPLFVKPSREGSSLGVYKVRNTDEYREALEEAFRIDRKLLVEQAVQGREIECSVLGNENPEAAGVLGEIVPRHEFYSYDAKYVDDQGAELIVPAEIEAKTALSIRESAVDAFRCTECRGMARVDFFLRDDGSFLLNEINTLPGFTSISMYPKLWEASGMPYSKLLERLIDLALE